MRLPVLLVCLLTMVPAPRSQAQAPQGPIFRFQPDNMWLNLHHYLYVLGRFEAKMSDINRRAQAGAPADEALGLAVLTDAEKTEWRQAVNAYAQGLSKKDAVFDVEMYGATGVLAALGSTELGNEVSLDRATELNPATRVILERAAPIYRKAWWPRHQKSNEDYVRTESRLVDQYGGRVLAYITRAYREPWPNGGYPVNISAFSNWAGAYSTHDILVVSSLDPGNRDLMGLEIVFHEAMHTFDQAMFGKLAAAARLKGGGGIPGGITHSMIFYTAGEAVRSVVTTHVPYAEVNDIWRRGSDNANKPLLDAAWKPYLDGKGTLNDALTGLIK